MQRDFEQEVTGSEFLKNVSLAGSQDVAVWGEMSAGWLIVRHSVRNSCR